MPHDMPGDVSSLTATQAVALIHGGKLRPEALMDAYIDRIATPDPTVLAFGLFDENQARTAAAAGLDWTGDPAFNFIWTSLHVPCVTVPAGTGPNGLPLGIQIVGHQGDDRAVLAWARWVESAIG